MSIQARAEAQRIYRMCKETKGKRWPRDASADFDNLDNLTYTSRYRCGLFIAGDESEVSNKYRDRMMVLVFELKADEIHKWRDIHFDAVQLLDRLELSGDQDVCIRYYERPSRDGDGPPNYLTVSDQDHGAGDQSGTVPRTDHYQRYLAEQNRNQQYAWYIAEQNQAVQAYEHAESLQQRAQWERQQRAAGNHDTTEHISIAEAARALTSIARLEEERAQRNAPPPYSQHSGLDPSHEGPALNGQLHEIIDFYNALANPSRRDRPGEEMYEPDSGTDLSDQSVAGSDKEDGQPFLRRPEMPPPAIEMR